MSDLQNKDNKILKAIKSAVQSLAFPVFAVFISFFVAVFFVMWSKGYGITQYFTALIDLIGTILNGSFGSMSQTLETTTYITPLIFTGVASALAFKCGLFNIGTEGQFTIGMIAAAVVGQIHGLSPIIHVPLVLIAGIVFGGLWGAVPGILKAKFGTNEVINCIMLNYIAMYVVNFIIMRTPFGIHSKAETPDIQDSAKLIQFSSLSRANTGIIIALICAVLIYYLLWKTTKGYEIRAVGINPSASKYGGINISKNIVFAMMLSGAIAGLGGAAHISGTVYNTTSLLSFVGYGLDGIAVALLAKSNPIGCIPAAILFGTLDSSSKMLQLNNIPKEIVYLIQSVVIVFVATDYIVDYFKDKRRKKEAVING